MLKVFWLALDVFGLVVAIGFAIAFAGWGMSFWGEPRPGAGLLFFAFATTALWWCR